MSAVFPINADSRWRRYTASAGQTVFPVQFPFQDDDDITVIKVTPAGAVTTLARPANYTLTGAGNPAGGALTLTAPAAAGDVIMPTGAAQLTRVLSIVRGGRYKSAATDADLDRLMMIAQEQSRDLGRSWKSDYGAPGGRIKAGAADTIATWGAGGDLVSQPDFTVAAFLAGAEAALGAQAALDSILDALGASAQDTLSFAVGGATQSANLGVAIIPKIAVKLFLFGVFQDPSTWSIAAGVVTPVGGTWPGDGVTVNLVAAIDPAKVVGIAQAMPLNSSVSFNKLDADMKGVAALFRTKVDLNGNGHPFRMATERFGYANVDTVGDFNEPNVWLYRATNHGSQHNPTPGQGNGGWVGRTFQVQTDILSDAQTFEVVGSFDLNEHFASTSNQDRVSLRAGATRFASAVGTVSSLWAGYIDASDLTRRKSSVSGGELRGAELNVKAQGPDDGHKRFGLDVILWNIGSNYDGTGSESVDGATTMYAGLRVTTAGALSNALLPMTIEHGFLSDAIGATNQGTILDGFKAIVNGASFSGLCVIGQPSLKAEIRGYMTGGPARAELGSETKTPGASLGSLIFAGRNSADADDVLYGALSGLISTNAAGNQSGQVNLSAAYAGGLQLGLALIPNVDAANPFNLRAAGALRKVELGAADSGGAGYRMFRTLN